MFLQSHEVDSGLRAVPIFPFHIYHRRWRSVALLVVLATLLCAVSTPASAGTNHYEQQIRFYNLSFEIPLEIRLSAVQVHLFVSQLRKVFLTGYFADRNYLFEEDQSHPRRIHLRIARFEPRQQAIIFICYQRRDESGGGWKTSEYMLEYNWRRVHFYDGKRRRQTQNQDDVLEATGELLEEACTSLQQKHYRYRYNAEHCAEQVLHIIEMLDM